MDSPDPFVALQRSIQGKHQMLLGAYGDQFLFTPPLSHLLVLGPPRVGKTAGTLAELVLAAEGPVVSTSTRKDKLRTTAMCRARKGVVWHLNLDTGVAEPGTRPLRFSPITRDFSQAIAMAEAMCFAAEVGASTNSASSSSQYFYSQAARLIGPALMAAAVGNESLEWVVDVVLSQNPDAYLPVVDVLASHDAEPGVRNAQRELEGILAMATTHGSGNDILATAARAFRVYNRPEVLGLASKPNFDPAVFVAGDESVVNPAMFLDLDRQMSRSGIPSIEARLPRGRYDTIFITASTENQRAVAPVIVGLLQALYQASSRLREHDADTGRYHRPMMTWALDEMASMAPWADFPTKASTAAGDGIQIAAVFHDLSQAQSKWGEFAAGSLRNAMGTTLVFPRIQDARTLKDLETTIGNHIVRLKSESTQQNRGVSGGFITGTGNQGSGETYTESEQWLPRIDTGRITKGHPDDPSALLLLAPWLPGDDTYAYVSPTPFYSNIPWPEVLAGSMRWTYTHTAPDDPRRLLPLPELDRDGGAGLYAHRTDEQAAWVLDVLRWARSERQAATERARGLSAA